MALNNFISERKISLAVPGLHPLLAPLRKRCTCILLEKHFLATREKLLEKRFDSPSCVLSALCLECPTYDTHGG